GKTTVAIDTILNQKDQDMICIYVAIGQKESTVRTAVETLRRHGALDYTIVVSASAAQPAPLLYIAPYSGVAMGEEFMFNGKHVLVVYDDLTKQAAAYRELSLLLRRPPGREAYPGDVFYLHSRLLERCAKLSDEMGGGSMTGLPIIETKANDVSAYIPTNVISITDGQCFLQSDMFNANQRPAVDVGISVSRVGGSAQTKALRKVSGTLKIALAQYRDLESFAMFASDLDDASKQQLNRGARLMELLKQAQSSPFPMEEQVVSIWAGSTGKFDDIEVEDVRDFEAQLLEHLRHNGTVLSTIRDTQLFESETEEELSRILEDVKKDFLAGKAEAAEARTDETRRMSADDIEQAQIVRGWCEVPPPWRRHPPKDASTRTRRDMGAQQRVYKQRIRSAQGMKKIFKAQEMIAASRISKAHARVLATTPYADAITRAIGSVATHSDEVAHPFLQAERSISGRSGILLITADRGMAGAYSPNAIRAAEQLANTLRDQDKEHELPDLGREIAAVVTEELLTEDLDRHIDELFVVGHRFETRFVQQTRSTRLVPLGLVEAETAEAAPTFPLYAFTPDADTVLEELIPRYVEARTINILLQSMASEHASRQRAMKTATDNAETQIDKSTRLANTARQAEITPEITEIVGGANALAGSGRTER